MTLFVIPPLITFLALMEFKVKKETLGKYFKFMDLPVGKGIYIIMMAMTMLEVDYWTEIVLAIVLTIIGLFNIGLGIFMIYDAKETERLRPYLLKNKEKEGTVTNIII
jgi:hypothetical protein